MDSEYTIQYYTEKSNWYCDDHSFLKYCIRSSLILLWLSLAGIVRGQVTLLCYSRCTCILHSAFDYLEVLQFSSVRKIWPLLSLSFSFMYFSEIYCDSIFFHVSVDILLYYSVIYCIIYYIDIILEDFSKRF